VNMRMFLFYILKATNYTQVMGLTEKLYMCVSCWRERCLGSGIFGMWGVSRRNVSAGHINMCLTVRAGESRPQ